MAGKLRLEFFHDCLSCWCYPFSERLRQFVVRHPDVEVVQRVYPMADAPDFFTTVFPDPVTAKREVVLQHWGEARDYERDDRIKCELMMERDFPYPYSIPNSRGCKAAEVVGGQAAHWDFFDRVQRAHLTDCENIGDFDVLKRCAADVGLDVGGWSESFGSEQVAELIREDMAAADRYGVLRNPAVVADARFQLPAEPKSIFGSSISDEALRLFYDDINRRGDLGYHPRVE